MPKRVIENDSSAVVSDAAARLASRMQPGSRGLIHSAPGTRQGLRLIDDHGSLTPDGTYYDQTTGHASADKRFDYSQEPIRRGARMQIKLLDVSLATVRSWDGVKRRWRSTKIHVTKDSYAVTFPASMSLVRPHGNINIHFT